MRASHFPILIALFLAAATLPRLSAQDADLQALQTLADDFHAHTHIKVIDDSALLPPAKIRISTTPPFSYYENRTVTESRFSELPPPVQQNFQQWAAFTTDQTSGEALFRDMFYRFFFVHELGHWLQARVLSVRRKAGYQLTDSNEDFYQDELQSNRISIAWWREHDPAYLKRLVADLRQIEAHLPNPVPSGQQKSLYFVTNYYKLQEDPAAYGWYQLDLVITAYDQPQESFQQVIDSLPSVEYKRN